MHTGYTVLLCSGGTPYSVSNIPVRYVSTAKNIFCIETRLAVSVDLSRPAGETQGYLQ